jgi:hypothetical protein
VHTPAWQVSDCVHALASLQGEPLGLAGFEHAPLAGLQVPVTWHWSEAEHVTGFEPTHEPPWHWSVCVHALASLHGLSLFGWRHVPVELHASVVQTFPSDGHGAPMGS